MSLLVFSCSQLFYLRSAPRSHTKPHRLITSSPAHSPESCLDAAYCPHMASNPAIPCAGRPLRWQIGGVNEHIFRLRDAAGIALGRHQMTEYTKMKEMVMPPVWRRVQCRCTNRCCSRAASITVLLQVSTFIPGIAAKSLSSVRICKIPV